MVWRQMSFQYPHVNFDDEPVGCTTPCVCFQSITTQHIGTREEYIISTFEQWNVLGNRQFEFIQEYISVEGTQKAVYHCNNQHNCFSSSHDITLRS